MGKGLTDAQQYLLQVFLNHSVIEARRFKDLFKEVLKKFQISHDPDDANEVKALYSEYLKAINAEIKVNNIRLVNGKCENLGPDFYCLIRLCESNGIGLHSNLYTQRELQMFRMALTMLVESETRTMLFNRVSAKIEDDFESNTENGKVPSKSEIELCLEKFIRDFWLAEVKTARAQTLCLHGRAILELAEYMKVVYGEEGTVGCQICKQIVMSGVQCPNEECPVRMHLKCAQKLFATQLDCPGCQEQFSEESLDQFNKKIASARNYQEGKAEAQ